MSETISNNLQGFTALVQQQAAAMQVSANTAAGAPVLNFTPGSILRSIAEAVSGVALWLQGLVLNLLLVTRAATSSGSDLDSWMADFGVSRILGSAASCATVQLTRYSTSQSVTIPPGGLLMTGDGSVQFTIVEDTGQSAWSATAGGYVMGIGISTIQVTASCTVAGTTGNVSAGTITQFASGIVGADAVTNSGVAAGGTNNETDAALRARFALFLVSLWKATLSAVTYGVNAVQAGLTVTVTENEDEEGNYKPGYFFVTVDDGSGSPPGTLITAAAAAVEQYRGLSITYAVHGPSVLTVNAVATIYVSPGFVSGAAIAAAEAAGAAFINSCVLGQSLSYFKTGSAITNASGVSEVASLTLNSTNADIVATKVQKIVAGTVTVSVA